MKVRLPYSAWLLCLTLSTAAASAQPDSGSGDPYPAPATVQGKTMLIPAGTTFEGRIDNKIGSSISRPGQRFNLTMSSPVLGNGVDVLIPAGTQIQGEVVEAVASGRLPHRKGEVKPTGKLRIQINGLRFPDGLTYPLVASLVAESNPRQRGEVNPGGGIGYVGSAASFEAHGPGSQSNWSRRGRSSRVMTRDELLQDPMYGRDSRSNAGGYQQNTIRSLVRRGHDLYIDQGSPLSVRLDAALKVVINPSSPVTITPAAPVSESGKRFKPPASANQPPRPEPRPAAPAQAPAADNSF